jgi:hypothetical protein
VLLSRIAEKIGLDPVPVIDAPPDELTWPGDDDTGPDDETTDPHPDSGTLQNGAHPAQDLVGPQCVSHGGQAGAVL